jgi:DNA-binding transcriptional ArsR family regulator
MNTDMSQLTEAADLMKAIAHPVRLCILRGLLEQGECNVSHIQACLELPQSTVSQHLAKLRQAGIVTPVRHGVEVYYSVSHPLVKEWMAALGR